MGQMDVAAYLCARARARGRVVTVAVDKTELLLPVFVGDELSCYCEIGHEGKSSVAVRVEAWVRRRDGGDLVKVTEGQFTLVAIGEDRRSRSLPPG